jgi:NAD(P)-dependent dehydrogenase (short-subunit alcohol dehydrogenase family)/acyl carrier protein
VVTGIVTDSLHSVTGDENLRSFPATIAAAGRGIPQEYPHLRCRSIDVVASEENLAESLIAELTIEPFSPVVAYRNGNRWLQEFEPTRLRETPEKSDLLADGAVYLITGGAGNIGFVLAKAIAQQVKAKLVLVGRSPFPDRAEWDSYIKTHARERTAERIRKITEVEQLGAEVMVVTADVTVRDEMQAVIAEVKERWGKIDGIIHGAANLAPAAFRHIGDIDKKNGNSHFQAKAHGLLVLEDLLRDEQPRFVILLSSISSVLGGLGLTAYAAANMFLDAEAQRQNRKGETHWLSINWDAWDFTAPVTPPDAISATHGGEAFKRILASAHEQVVVAATPLPARVDKWIKLTNVAATRAESVQVMAAVAASGNGSGIQSQQVTNQVHARPELSTQYAPPRTETEKKVTAVWEHLLGLAPIGIHDKFFELGGHSLLAIQLLAQLRETFAMDLPVQRIFEAPTVSQLSDSIDRDRAAMPDTKVDENGDGDDSLASMMKLVEGLSEAELDELLSEAEAMQMGE